jgi:hypothetical protein
LLPRRDSFDDGCDVRPWSDSQLAGPWVEPVRKLAESEVYLVAAVDLAADDVEHSLAVRLRQWRGIWKTTRTSSDEC